MSQIIQNNVSERTSLKILFKNTNFTKIWSAQFVSNFGSYISSFSFPLLAFLISGEEFWLGIIAIASMIPSIGISPLAGVVADRFSRKKIMIVSNLASAFTIFLIPIGMYYYVKANITDFMIFLTIIMFLSSILQRFFSPAESASIPLIVQEKYIGPAVSLSQSTQHLIRVIGPIIGIAIATTLGYSFVFILDALTFLVSGIIIGTIKTNLDLEKSKDSNKKINFILGSKTLFNIPTIRFVGTIFFFVMFGVSLSNNFLVAMAKEELFMSDGEYGLAFSLTGLTGVISGLLLSTRISKVTKPLNLVTIGLFINGLIWILFSTIKENIFFTLILMMGGVVSILLRVPGTTVFMRDTPNQVIGQVFSSLDMLESIASLIGMVLGTILVTIIGIRELFLLNGSLQFTASIFSIFYLIYSKNKLKIF